MPGYYVHLSASNKLARKNRNFTLGVSMPDLLKHYAKNYNIDEVEQKYNIIKTDEMPDFSFFEKRVQQKEIDGTPSGMHYGWSSNPDVIYFWNSLTNLQKQNPFFIGYLWHLLTDLVVYKYLNINEKFEHLSQEHADDLEFIELEINKLHDDWDRINCKVKDSYPDVIIPPEIQELGIIKYVDGKTFYANWDIIKSLIDFMRQFDPLSQDVDKIIETIMNFLANNKKIKK